MNRAHSSRGRPHIARRLLALRPGELTDLLDAQVQLIAARSRVRRRPTGTLLRPMRSNGLRTGDRFDESRLERIAIAIDRVSRLGIFRPTCLMRAMALESMIRRENPGAAVVRVGVARGRNALLAHAWIELGGRVIGDEAAYVRQFTPLQDFSALAP